jgi:enamine deaminase RidA (YjgF/YER057c/UK114 family)
MKEIMVDIATGVTIIVLLAIVLFNLSSCAAFQDKDTMAPVVKNVCAMACDRAEELTLDQCKSVCSQAGENYADLCSVACSVAVEIGEEECNEVCTEKINDVLKNTK